MAYSFQSPFHQTFDSPPLSLIEGKWVQDASGTAGSVGLASTPSRRQSWVTNSEKTSVLGDIVRSLSSHSSKEIASSKIVAADYPAFVQWISSERMQKLPPEGSNYDKALYWARLLAEHLHTFDLAIEQFAGDSHMAVQLAYVHCASLLALGEQNSCALMDLFSFFYQQSMNIEQLLDHKELFFISQNVKDQLVLALADLVTIIVGVSTHFHKELETRTPAVSVVEIYSMFAEPIDSLRHRCELASTLMWEYQLLNGKFESRKVDVKAIRRWLEPEDPALARIVEITIQLAQEREESTCLWLGSTISQFLKGEQRKLAFIGKPCSGKSILASVINDQLRQPWGGVRYRPVYVPINGRVPASTHAWAVAKCILLQLFTANIGNVRLYQVVQDAHERCSKAKDIESYEAILFKALENAFQTSAVAAREPVLVVDGLDEAMCGQKSLLTRLTAATAKVPNLKMIMFAADEDAASMADTTVHITSELVLDDIAAVSRRVLQNCGAFNQTTETQGESIVYRIAKAANGSFLWAKLAAKEIGDNNPPNAQVLSKAIDKLEKGNHSITDMVTRRLEGPIPEEGKTILIWLLAVARPLAISELAALLSVKKNGDSTGQREQDPLHVLKDVSSLIFCHNDMVYLRHEQLREAITNALAKRRPTPVREGHIDLTQRLLLYIKQNVVDGREPSKSFIDPQVRFSLVERHGLLDFALRYWASHAQKAYGFVTEQGVEVASQDLGPLLPETPIAISLATSIWEYKPTPVLVELYSIQARIYQQAFSTSHPATLQAILSQALFHQQTETTTTSDTAEMFYNAATICQGILSASHALTMQITQDYLYMTTTQVSEIWTATMQHREQMLWQLFEGYEASYGSTSQITYTILTQILNHYELLKREDKRREVEDMMNKFPKPDDRPANGSLTVQVVRPKDPADMLQLNIGEDETDLAVQQSFDFDGLLQSAQYYVSIGNFEKAEQLFVRIWWTTSKEYWIRRSSEWELMSIKAILSYCEYLVSQKKETSTAITVLLSFWEEHKHTLSSSQTILAHLVEVGKLMESVNLSWFAVEVFHHCAQYLSTQSALYDEVQSHIQKGYQTVFEHEDEMIESVLEEIVREWSATNKITIIANDRLAARYWSQGRWSLATAAIIRVLNQAWPGFLTCPISDAKLPQHDTSHCIEMADRLRRCYCYRHLVSGEENVTLRLYYALRGDRSGWFQKLDHITNQLLQFYERNGEFEKLIRIFQTAMNDDIQRFGEDHATVLKWLQKLAKITHPSPVSITYYRQIFRIINKDSETCHPDAFEPLVIVARELVNQGYYSDAVQYYQVLFNSLQHEYLSPKLRDPEFLRAAYVLYLRSLRMVNATVEAIHDVTLLYRDTCVAVFGSAAVITVHATLDLAYICRESEKYRQYAIKYYKELLCISSDQINHEEVQAILDAMDQEQYAPVVSVQSTEEIRESIAFHRKRLSRAWSRQMLSHTEISALLRDLVSLHLKENDTQAAVAQLQKSIFDALSIQTSEATLLALSKDIASCYISSGLSEQASSLSQDLYHQIVFGTSQNELLQKLDTASSWNSAMILLAQFEYVLLQREGLWFTVDEIHSTLAAEYLLFHQLASEINSETSTVFNVIKIAGDLHRTLGYRARWAAVSHLIERCTNYFQVKEGKRAQLAYSESKVLIDTLMRHFSTHTTQDFLRSTAIATYNRVRELLESGDCKSASDLAQAAFKYIWAQDHFENLLVIVKVLFQVSMAISGRNLQLQPETAVKENMVKISATIMKELIRYCAVKNIDVSGLNISSINTIIGVLDEVKDYHTLASLLTALWDSRERYGSSQLEQAYTLALGRRLVITRSLIGDDMSALHLAEDLAYNCSRVHGPLHPITIEMNVLLSQMYTSVAQNHQKSKAQRELADRYYRKAATIHENALRAFLDPHPTLSIQTVEWSSPESSGRNSPQPGSASESLGSHVRRHLHLLKLATERLGDWSKDYSVYEKLNSDLFKAFGDELAGVDGVEKWKINNFGNGRAEANDDLLSSGPQIGLDMRLPIPV